MLWPKETPEPKRFYCIVHGYEHKSQYDGFGCLTLSPNIGNKDELVLSQEGRKSLMRFLDHGET